MEAPANYVEGCAQHYEIPQNICQGNTILATKTEATMSENEKIYGTSAHVTNLGSMADGYAAGPRKLTMTIPSAAADDLRCLFFHGPTWDGNVPSKSGRDELVRMGLAARGNGWQWLTAAGIQACFDNGIQHEKDRRESQERKRRNQLHELAATVLGINLPATPPQEQILGAGQAQRVDER